MNTTTTASELIKATPSNQLNSLEVTDIAHQGLSTYYRSKLFNSTIGINNIVAAAHPLLSIIERLKFVDSAPEFDLIKDNLNHELNAFESKVSSFNYPVETVILARYLVAATLDESLAKCLQRFELQCQFIAFSAISKDGTGPEQRFFEITDKALEKPTNNLDLLELSYLCLSAGFEGRYHEQVDGRQLLDDKIEQLYQAINQHRSIKPQNLFKRETTIKKVEKNPRKNYAIYTLIAVITIAASVAINHVLVERKVEQVLSLRGNKLTDKQ